MLNVNKIPNWCPIVLTKINPENLFMKGDHSWMNQDIECILVKSFRVADWDHTWGCQAASDKMSCIVELCIKF